MSNKTASQITLNPYQSMFSNDEVHFDKICFEELKAKYDEYIRGIRLDSIAFHKAFMYFKSQSETKDPKQFVEKFNQRDVLLETACSLFGMLHLFFEELENSEELADCLFHKTTPEQLKKFAYHIINSSFECNFVIDDGESESTVEHLLRTQMGIEIKKVPDEENRREKHD